MQGKACDSLRDRELDGSLSWLFGSLYSIVQNTLLCFVCISSAHSQWSQWVGPKSVQVRSGTGPELN
jgi:hypothetical protein